jgi:dihydrofolate synthase/folylpolyglutamate synthase
LKTLSDWLSHLEGLHPKGQAGIELGLDRIRLVKDALGQSQHCPVIVVGGTNGKGSTCAYLKILLIGPVSKSAVILAAPHGL